MNEPDFWTVWKNVAINEVRSPELPSSSTTISGKDVYSQVADYDLVKSLFS